jgi:hypothetical protein
MVQILLKQRKIAKRYDNIMGGLSLMQSLVIIHPFQLPAGWKLSRPHIRSITWNNI